MPWVTSTKLRFAGGTRVRPGTPFSIPEGVKLSKDMTLVEAPAEAAEPAAKVKKPKAKAPETFSEMAKQDHKDLTPKGAGSDDDLV